MVINTNVEAQRTANNLNVSQNNLAKSLSRLSSGSRIVNPSDDAAGLAVSSRLRAQIKRLDSALSNVVNAVSFTQTQDGFMKTIDKAFRRMGELSMLARDETKSADDRALYDQEFQQLMDYVNDTKSKEFNSVSLFDGADIAVTIDAEGDVFEMDGIEMTGKKYTNALDNLGPLTNATGANTGDTITMTAHGFEDGDPAYFDANWAGAGLAEFEADGTTRKKYVVEVVDANTFQVHPVGTKYDEDTDSFVDANGAASTIAPLTADVLGAAGAQIYKYSKLTVLEKRISYAQFTNVHHTPGFRGTALLNQRGQAIGLFFPGFRGRTPDVFRNFSSYHQYLLKSDHLMAFLNRLPAVRYSTLKPELPKVASDASVQLDKQAYLLAKAKASMVLVQVTDGLSVAKGAKGGSQP